MNTDRYDGAVVALENYLQFRSGNIRVDVDDEEAVLLFHGEEIAARERTSGELVVRIYDARSDESMDILNRLVDVDTYYEQGHLELNGAEWEGDWMRINRSGIEKKTPATYNIKLEF